MAFGSLVAHGQPDADIYLLEVLEALIESESRKCWPPAGCLRDVNAETASA